jgi:hypothetical protein
VVWAAIRHHAERDPAAAGRHGRALCAGYVRGAPTLIREGEDDLLGCRQRGIHPRGHGARPGSAGSKDPSATISALLEAEMFPVFNVRTVTRRRKPGVPRRRR